MSNCQIIYHQTLAGELRSVFEARLKAMLADFKNISPHDILADFTIMIENDAYLRELNHQFRGIDKPTNVLSFPADEADYLGDIAISIETIDKEAKEQGKPVLAHLTHMALHGLLHLLGYDHEDSEEAEDMEVLEIKILARQKIENPYAQNNI